MVGLISYHADRLKEWCRSLRDTDNQESFEMFCTTGGRATHAPAELHMLVTEPKSRDGDRKNVGSSRGPITAYRRSPPGVTPACSSSRYPP